MRYPRVVCRLALPLATAALLLAGAVPSAAQTADDLFNADTLQEIRLSVNSRDLTVLRTFWDQNITFPATLTWRGIKVQNIGVRAHGGTGSRNPQKIALELDFDEYTKNQRFVGLESLLLKNEWADASLIRDHVSMAFFARMGYIASRTSFARVYVNNEYWGLYGVVENVDPTYLTRYLGENAGYLFEFHLIGYWTGEYLGDAFDEYKLRFDPITRKKESDTLIYGPIQDFLREVNSPDDPSWRERVERLIDLRQFITFVAIEEYLSETDGITGLFSMNNFNLYRRADSTVHRFFPWDRDLSLQQTTGDAPIFARTDLNVWTRRALAYSDLRTLYLDVMENCARAAMQDDWFLNTVLNSAAVTSTAVREDPKKQFTNEAYDAHIQALIGYASLRPAFVLKEVASARGQN